MFVCVKCGEDWLVGMVGVEGVVVRVLGVRFSMGGVRVWVVVC